MKKPLRNLLNHFVCNVYGDVKLDFLDGGSEAHQKRVFGVF